MNARASTSLLPALLLVGAPLPGAAADLHAAIDQGAAAIEQQVIAWRRDIHQHPELSNREQRTAALVAEHLRSLGIEVRTGVAHTGVVGVLEGGRSGRVVALRADMDALPVVEQTGLPYASTVRAEYLGDEVGVMHACGHDNHVAILMGAASVLAGLARELPGTVTFVFQPAEEGPPPGETGGAGLMVEEGVLTNPEVDAIFGLHVGQNLAVGQAGYRPEGMMASSQRFEIVIRGRQTHGAMPWAGVDPIVIGAHVVTALQTIVSRTVDVTSAPAVVTVGTFQAGVRNNIVPDTATLSGTIRTFDEETTARVHRQVEAMATQIAQSFGGSAEVSISEGNPVTFNDPGLASRMRPSLERVYGERHVLEIPRVTVAEDFSEYQRHVPGLFFFVGVRPNDVPLEKAIPNHSPFFYADEAALVDGVRAMVSLAADYLSAPADAAAR